MPFMVWKTIRLELACTDAFPRGSAGRAFLLHVPIAGDGRIDRLEMDQHPGRATVRRYWGSEPDSFGPVEALEDSWALCCTPEVADEPAYLLDAVPLHLNDRVNVRQPVGGTLPFRVASVQASG
jgi:hypothetical protein